MMTTHNLIHKDTANHISAIKTKYFLSSDYFVDGPRKSLCSNRAIYPPITLTNKNITADFCLTENKKVYAIELNFTNVNYISDAILIEQLKTHKFEKGSFYRIDDYINSEYIRKEDSLYIETKWKDDKIFAIKFK